MDHVATASLRLMQTAHTRQNLPAYKPTRSLRSLEWQRCHVTGCFLRFFIAHLRKERNIKQRNKYDAQK